MVREARGEKCEERFPLAPHPAETGKGVGMSGSVPSDLDSREPPEVRVAHAQQVAAGRCAPAEGRHVVPRRPAGSHQPKGAGHAEGGDLAGGGNMEM